MLLFWAIFSLANSNTVVGKGNQAYFQEQFTEIATRVLRLSTLWLNDLEKSYEIGFSHQFKHLKYINISSVPNHNVHSDIENKCRNVSFFSFDQNRRLMEQFRYESFLNSTIHEMLDNPRARLFQFEDNWGEFEDYHFLRSIGDGMCFDLKELSGRVKSVFTFGKCVRLFEEKGCRGWSIAIYPGSPNSHQLEVPRHVTLKAIGPCLENEFSGGSLNKTFPGFVNKNPELRSFQPDLALMFKPGINWGRTKDFGELYINYVLGPGNRTEVMKARTKNSEAYFCIHPKTNVEERDFGKSFEKEDGDVLGHAVPTTIGGPATETFNIFPANQSALNEWDDLLLGNSRNNVRTSFLLLQFEYENRNKTRPLFFYFWIFVKERESDHIKYGRILNGHQTNLRRDKAFQQFMPKFEYKGTATINLVELLDRHRGIPKIMDFFSSNTSLQNVNRRAAIPMLNWHECKNANFPNDKELNGNVTQSFLLNARIRGMIKNPMVRLFSGENLTGDFEERHSGQKIHWRENYKGCYPVHQVTNATSAEPFGTCIRLFNESWCTGSSLAIYGRSGNSYKINIIITQVQSVGPCLQDEMINATIRDEIKGEVVKDQSRSYFPDLVQFGGFSWDNISVFATSALKIYYVLGHKNRIEYIRTKIDQVGPVHLPNLSISVEGTEFYNSLGKNEGDVPCFAIPLAFNGPGNESFNIFPVNQSKVSHWANIFPPLPSDAYEDILFSIELNFVYESDNSSRPQFIYYFLFSYSDEKISYGRFNNL